jgi:hypothetical protein
MIITPAVEGDHLGSRCASLVAVTRLRSYRYSVSELSFLKSKGISYKCSPFRLEPVSTKPDMNVQRPYDCNFLQSVINTMADTQTCEVESNLACTESVTY